MKCKGFAAIAMLFIMLCGSVFGLPTRAYALRTPASSKEGKPHSHYKGKHHEAHPAKRHSQHKVRRS
jgi:hypothetical protein